MGKLLFHLCLFFCGKQNFLNTYDVRWAFSNLVAIVPPFLRGMMVALLVALSFAKNHPRQTFAKKSLM